MARKKKNELIYVADFETNNDYEKFQSTADYITRVWLWVVVALEDESNEVHYGYDIKTFFDFLLFNTGATFYFHNLKFDGDFIINYLFENGYKHIENSRELASKTFSTLITDMGMWYSLEICFCEKECKKTTIKIIDSLKVLPFRVEQIPKAFGFDEEYQKLEIDYNKERNEGYIATPFEIKYASYDVIIVKKALKILRSYGLTKMTVASNAFTFYRKEIVGVKYFKKWFPTLGCDSEIRKAYRGGYVRLQDEYKNKIVHQGLIFDVNSLYPSVMYDKELPYDEPIYFEGEYKSDENYPLYVVCLTASFKLKKGFIPTVSGKGHSRFSQTEYLEDSCGEMTLTMTSIDLQFLLNHYDVDYIIYHYGYKFRCSENMFKNYVDHWSNEKIKAKEENNEGMYTISKLMLNSLYGRFALTPEVQNKIPYPTEKGYSFELSEVKERKPIYIPVAVFITAYAREITIKSAQANYERYIYSDTDSLHLKGYELPTNIEIHNTKLGAWKLETKYTHGKYLRAKSYLTIYNEESEEYEEGKIPVLKVTCAGMSEKQHKYVNVPNFKIGAKYKDKLQAKRVKGGTMLINTEFTIKA